MTEAMTIDHEPAEDDGRQAPARSPDEIREARALVPAAAQQPAQIMNLSQQIEFAQAMAKAVASIPKEFRGNVGDCLAIVDIALRAGLSPYMLAQKMYVERTSGRIAMESQAYHALVQTPGFLVGDLDVTYEGEGEDTVCIVRGILASDPSKVREHRSEPLAKARPPKNGDGIVKGSPDWVRKPRKQLFYDTSRDWVRMFAPRATMGLYTGEELAEYAAMAPEKPAGKGLKERLAAADRREGHNPDQVASDLNQLDRTKQRAILPAKKGRQKADDAEGHTQAPVRELPATPRRNRRQERAAAARGQPEHTETLINPKHEPTPEKVAQIADRAEGKKEPEPPAGPPKTADEYKDYAVAWIEAATNGVEAAARWAAERDMRDDLGVRVPVRESLQLRLDDKFPTDPKETP